VTPLTSEQYKVQVTVGRETIEKLRRAQDLMRHTIPNGDPAAIIDRALTVLLAQLERTKLAATDRPQKGRDPTPGSRHVPARVRRAVWARDEGRCAFISADGRRCQERGLLELHHTTPYAAGGEATVETIELRCRAHNLFEAEIDFGPSVRERRSAPDASTAV
jgi:5-methylcytosine-specific restriction endonuclease McrA